MESGSGPKDPQPFGPGSPGFGPGGQQPPENDRDEGPQSPAPGPQSPAPSSEPPTPSAPQAPEPGGEQGTHRPYQPPQPESPVPAAGTSSSYGGPVPPGGWDQPMSPAGAGAPAPMGELASWWSRVGATLLDTLIIGIPAMIVLGAFGVGFASSDDDGSVIALIAGGLLSLLVFLVIAFIYAPLTMARGGLRNGQTLGKQAVGIRVVKNDGQPIGFGFAALREIVVKGIAVGIAGNITFGLAALIDYLWPLWDDENRALHDMAVSTHVVRA